MGSPRRVILGTQPYVSIATWLRHSVAHTFLIFILRLGKGRVCSGYCSVVQAVQRLVPEILKRYRTMYVRRSGDILGMLPAWISADKRRCFLHHHRRMSHEEWLPENVASTVCRVEPTAYSIRDRTLSKHLDGKPSEAGLLHSRDWQLIPRGMQQ